MTGSDWAVIAVAVLGLIGALLSARSARAAAKYNVEASHASARAEAETEAYNRARAMDVKTIERQDQEIEELRKENGELKKHINKIEYEQTLMKQKNLQQQDEIDSLKRHIARLSRESGNNG